MDNRSPRQARFVEEYAKDQNATNAAIRAGYSEASAHAQGCRLLKNAEIQRLIGEQRQKVSRQAVVDAAFVLTQWTLIATADPSKISRVRRVNCRHCWGVGHEYQWSPREYAKACDETAKRDEPLPDCTGGFDWAHNRTPNPDCPDCKGEGHEETFFEDMDKLGPAERRLIAAVEKTKDGIKVKMRDQTNAVDRIAQYLGMLVEKRELTGKDGAPLQQAAVVSEATLKTLAAMSPEQLRALASKPIKE